MSNHSPRTVATTALRELPRRGDPERARGQRAYFKVYDRVRFVGMTAGEVRAWARAVHHEVKHAWTLADALAFAQLLMRDPHLEAKLLGTLVLARFRRQFDRTVATALRQWIARGWCANWATIDSLCGEILGPLIDDHPAVFALVVAWGGSPDLWLRRASIVALVRSARRGKKLDAVYAAVRRRLRDPEDLMHKACGWVLREAGKTDMPRLERFLRRYGPTMARTSVRYAIERFAPEKRVELLERTRPAPGRRVKRR